MNRSIAFLFPNEGSFRTHHSLIQNRFMKTPFHTTLAVLLVATTLFSCSESETSSTEAIKKSKEGKVEKTVSAVSFPDGNYTIDSKYSSFGWEGKEASGTSHTGDIQIHKGSMSIMDNSFHTAFVGINMGTINCTDLEGDAKSRLEQHLKSADFFGSEKHQYSTLDVIAIKTKNGETKAVGTLTIKGITKPVGFPATLSLDGDNIVVDGTLVFDRSDFDVRFRSDKWYSDLGDKLIYNDIALNYHLVARPS